VSHDLNAVAQDCLQTLRQLNIPTGMIREFYADSRSRRRWGVCKKEPDGSFRIGISVRLLENGAPLQSLRETIFHELLHTAPGCMNHAGRWKQYAALLNKTMGLSIRTSTGAEALGVKPDPRIRYRFRCQGCGAEQIRYRACDFTRHPERYRCGRCGGHFRAIPRDLP